MNLQVRQSFLLVRISSLIDIADDFDEVDFGVSHEVNLDDLSSEQHAQFNSRGSRANTAGSRTAFGRASHTSDRSVIGACSNPLESR